MKSEELNRAQGYKLLVQLLASAVCQGDITPAQYAKIVEWMHYTKQKAGTQ